MQLNLPIPHTPLSYPPYIPPLSIKVRVVATCRIEQFTSLMHNGFGAPLACAGHAFPMDLPSRPTSPEPGALRPHGTSGLVTPLHHLCHLGLCRFLTHTHRDCSLLMMSPLLFCHYNQCSSQVFLGLMTLLPSGQGNMVRHSSRSQWNMAQSFPSSKTLGAGMLMGTRTPIM